jgi:hypothetical protein
LPASTVSLTLNVRGASTASAYLYPIEFETPKNLDIFQFANLFSYISSTVAGSQSLSFNYALYKDTNGFGDDVERIGSASFSIGVSMSSGSATFNYPVSSSPYVYTTQAFTGSAQIQSNFGTVGVRMIGAPLGDQGVALYPEGLYWVGLHQRQSTVGFNGGLHNTIIANAMALQGSVGELGKVSSNSFLNFLNIKYPFGGMGVMTSTGLAGFGGTTLPSVISGSALIQTLTQMPLITYLRP